MRAIITGLCSNIWLKTQNPGLSCREQVACASYAGRLPGMGKRGGLRVIYYVQDEQGRIWLLTLYGKAAQENISAKTLKLMREAADYAEII